MLRCFKQFVRDSKAVSGLEYAILVGVIAVALVTLMDQFTVDMKNAVEKVGDNILETTKTVGE